MINQKIAFFILATIIAQPVQPRARTLAVVAATGIAAALSYRPLLENRIQESLRRSYWPVREVQLEGLKDLKFWLSLPKAPINGRCLIQSEEASHTFLNFAASWSALTGNLAPLQALLDAKTDVHVRDSRDNTPLLNFAGHARASHTEGYRETLTSYVQVTRKLLEAGSDIFGKDRKGRDPLYLAVRQQNVELVSAFAEKMGSVAQRSDLRALVERQLQNSDFASQLSSNQIKVHLMAHGLRWF